MNPRKIAFRVDASLKIGTGHVMRCLTLAEALRDRGCESTFICREHPGNLIDLISERGFTALGLPAVDVAQDLGLELNLPPHAAWLGADWRTDATQTRKAIGDVTADWLVIDHYAIDERWERKLRPACRRLMVIDDLADRNHDSTCCWIKIWSKAGRTAIAATFPKIAHCCSALNMPCCNPCTPNCMTGFLPGKARSTASLSISGVPIPTI